MKNEQVLSKKGKATTINELYNIPCLDVMPLFLVFLYMMESALPKNKRQMKSEKELSKSEKATNMNELYTTYLVYALYFYSSYR